MNLKQYPKMLDSKTSCLRITVPENLDLALEGLIRKVLREQPKTDDIYSFAANYFETLLAIRDKAGPKFVASQVCPFHNDDDAHEMVKIAGTFSKSSRRNLDSSKMKKETRQKKEVRRAKPKQTSKEKIFMKQPTTPDLIKKLPMATEDRVMEESQTSERPEEGRKSNVTLEKMEVDDEEFLTSDPIKELVEKELMMEGKVTVKEGKGLNQTACSARDLESSEGGAEKQNKQETQNANGVIMKKDGKEGDKTESGHQQEINKAQQAETVKSVETNEKNTDEKHEETLEIATGKEENLGDAKKLLKTASEEINKPEDIQEPHGNVQSLTETNNAPDDTPNRTKLESQTPTAEEEKDKMEEEHKQPTETGQLNLRQITQQETTPEEISTKAKEVREVQDAEPPVEMSPPEISQQEKKIKKATVGQEPETEIDKETKATDENTAKTARESLPVEGDSFPENSPVVSVAKLNESEEQETGTAAEPTSKNEEGNTPSQNELETRKEVLEESEKNSAGVREGEHTEVIEKLKETLADESEIKKNRPDSVNAEKKDDSEAINQDGETDLEKPEEKGKTIESDKSSAGAEPQTHFLEAKSSEEDVIKKSDKEDQKFEIPNSERNQTELLQSPDNNTALKENTQSEETQTKDTLIETENDDQITGESVIETQSAPGEECKPSEESEENYQSDKNQTEEELCRVVDNQHVQKKEESETQSQEDTKPEVDQNLEETPQEMYRVVDAQSIPEKEILKPEAKVLQYKENQSNPEEMCTVVDVRQIPEEDTTNGNNTGETQPESETTQNKVEETPHITEPEKVPEPPDDLQIKMIQTHYYDTLEVPETITKEYIVHNVITPPMNTLLGTNNTLPENNENSQNPKEQTVIDENMNATPSIENVSGSPPPKAKSDILTPETHLESLRTDVPLPADAQNRGEVESSPQITDSDDLLDIMTPTSGYSLNLSEISWQTISGMFLESEKRYNCIEKEEIRYAASKSDEGNRQEVEEVILKTVIPTGSEAVPVPPREAEEINEEVNADNSESATEKDKEKPKGESEDSSDSTNERSADSDVPFISVEVKTVIETQVLDDEEEKNNELRGFPDVEVKVEATIDIQDDVGVLQSDPDSIEENKISDEKSQHRNDLKSSLEEEQSKSQEEQQKENCSTEQTTGREGSSGESDSTVSSAATEIKRTDSAKRNFSSTRSLLSTQSLDLGKRNPLLKTRSLSTFRHGVTDFEVWNTIEKELEEAATKIQSKFRGYKTRKKLQRENAVQITTEESSVNTTPVEIEAKGDSQGQQSTGEFHDSIVLAEHPR